MGLLFLQADYFYSINGITNIFVCFCGHSLYCMEALFGNDEGLFQNPHRYAKYYLQERVYSSTGSRPKHWMVLEEVNDCDESCWEAVHTCSLEED